MGCWIIIECLITCTPDSIYGFCGATAGFLPCIAIAATVTAIGRKYSIQCWLNDAY